MRKEVVKWRRELQEKGEKVIVVTIVVIIITAVVMAQVRGAESFTEFLLYIGIASGIVLPIVQMYCSWQRSLDSRTQMYEVYLELGGSEYNDEGEGMEDVDSSDIDVGSDF